MPVNYVINIRMVHGGENVLDFCIRVSTSAALPSGLFFFLNGTWRAAEKMKKTTPPSQTQLLDFAPQACLFIKADPLSKWQSMRLSLKKVKSVPSWQRDTLGIRRDDWRSSVAKWGSRQACLLPTWLYFSQSCFNTPVDPWILPLPELVPVPRWEYCSFTFYLFQEPHLLAQNESFYHNIAFVFDCSICRRCEGRRRSCCFDNQKFQLVYWR